MADFVWRVSQAGYEWQPHFDIQGNPIALCTLGNKGAKAYQPLRDEPSLYLRFTELEDTLDACIAFANQFGHLTAGVTVIDERGYPIESAFANELRLPSLMPEGGFWDTVSEVETELEAESVWGSHMRQMRSTIKEWKESTSGPMGVAESRYGKTIISNLWHRVVPSYDPSGSLSYRPLDLLGAMWLQFAQAVGRGGVPRQCQNCSEWFVISDHSRSTDRRTRSDKTYCGKKCQMAAAYARKLKKRLILSHEGGKKKKKTK